MNDNVPPETPLSCKKTAAPLFLVLICGLVAGLGASALLNFDMGKPTQTAVVAHALVEDGDQARRLQALEARIEALEAKPQSDSAAALAETKSETGSLQESVKGLQAETRALIDQAAQSRSHVDTGLASVVAFVQLRAAAETARPFAPELQRLKHTVDGDAALQDEVSALEPKGASGVATIATLRDQFAALVPDAQNASRRATASTWQDRVKVLFQSLVSVRDRRDAGNPDSLLDSMERDLAAGRLDAALEKQAHLPDAAQLVVQEWRDRAKARLDLDAAIDRIAAGLIGKVKAQAPKVEAGGQ